jgi:hypothetical protein
MENGNWKAGTGKPKSEIRKWKLELEILSCKIKK